MKKIRSKYIKGLEQALNYGDVVFPNNKCPYATYLKRQVGIRRFKVAYKNYKKQVTLQQLLRG